MNLRFISSRFDAAASANALSPLKIVGLYADLPAYLLAMRVLHNVGEECSTDCKLSVVWWSFDTLSAEHGQTMGTDLANEADMVWCSTNACEALPESLKACVAAWASTRREAERALVALLRCPPDYKMEQSPARTYLGQLAEAAGIELFVQRFDCGCTNSAGPRPPTSKPPSAHETPFEERHPCQQFRHWGLNE